MAPSTREKQNTAPRRRARNKSIAKETGLGFLILLLLVGGLIGTQEFRIRKSIKTLQNLSVAKTAPTDINVEITKIKVIPKRAKAGFATTMALVIEGYLGNSGNSESARLGIHADFAGGSGFGLGWGCRRSQRHKSYRIWWCATV